MYDTPSSNFEASEKGFRRDVYVQIDDVFYNVCPYILDNLIWEYTESKKEDGYYTPFPNLIFVEDMSKKTIIKTIEHVYEKWGFWNEKTTKIETFFDALKPITNIDFQKLTKIN